MLVGTEAEMLEGLTSVLGATEQQGVGTGGLLKSELIKGLGLAAGSNDASTGGGGEAQSSDIDLGDLEEAVVIGDGTDNNDGLLLVAVLEVGGNAGEGDGRAVDARHEEATEHDLVEGRVGTACGRKVSFVLRNNHRESPGQKTYEPRSGKASPGA